MRKIEEQMIKAIQNKKEWKNSNTRVIVIKDEPINKEYPVDDIYITLFDRTIAQLLSGKELLVKDARYQTATTKSRLNAILFTYKLPRIYQENYQWYIGDEKWEGQKTFNLG